MDCLSPSHLPAMTAASDPLELLSSAWPAPSRCLLPSGARQVEFMRPSPRELTAAEEAAEGVAGTRSVTMVL